MESKKAIYDLIPMQSYPKTLLVKSGTSFEEIRLLLVSSGLVYPIIAKPDIGLRGSGVKKIESDAELERYAKSAKFDFLLQDFIRFPMEAGIFYVRHPNEESGTITGIVYKELLTVTGDGKSTMIELLQLDKRHHLQLESLQKQYGDSLKEILPNLEKRTLVPYGNHARGAKFLDASQMITPALIQTIDAFCRQIPEFYFGRLDLMFESWQKLETGEFQIVEVNGAASEPTHIYDPKHSFLFGWKELLRHNTLMYNISKCNHSRGFRYLSHREGMRQYREHQQHNKRIKEFI